MFETTDTVFWAALGGLTLALLGCGVLIVDARSKAQNDARLMRAAGHNQSRAAALHAPGDPMQTRALKWLKALIVQTGERFSAVLGGEAEQTAAELRTAGFKGRDALLVYAFVKTVLPLGAALVGIVWVLIATPSGKGLVVPMGTVVALALALSKGVDIALDVIRKKRLGKIRAGVADFLELLVITSEAGLGPQPALRRVSQELTAAHPELSQEILQMVAEMRMTNDNRAAYAGLSQRVPLPEIGVFTQTLDQSDRYGTPFSRAMRTLMAELRSDRLLRMEEKAARMPVIMTVPLIFCIMPSVFVVLIGPAVLNILDNIIQGG